MTVKSFIKRIVEYYGEYSRPYILQLMIDYLNQKMNDGELDMLFSHLVKTYSTAYKTQPDVAALEKARAEIAETRAYPGRPFGGGRIDQIQAKQIDDGPVCTPEEIQKNKEKIKKMFKELEAKRMKR